jgi:hypothetical protein
MHWLAAELPLPCTPMQIGTVEAMKKGVAMGLGLALVPGVAVAEPLLGVVVRPLDPPMPSTMALAEHRNKPDEPALAIVRQALLELKTIPDAAPEARSLAVHQHVPGGEAKGPSRGDLRLVARSLPSTGPATPFTLSVAAVRKPVPRRVSLAG